MSRSISKPESTLVRFHPILYISFVCLSLAIIIWLYFSIYSLSTTAASQTNVIDTSFNQETIERIEALNTPEDQTHNLTFPEGRLNPFI